MMRTTEWVRPSWAAASLLGLVGAASCVQRAEAPDARQWQFRVEGDRSAPPAPHRGADVAAGPRPLEKARTPPQDTYEAQVQSRLEAGDPGPFQRYAWNVIQNGDGTITKLYYLRTQNPKVDVYINLMKRFVPGFASLQESRDYWHKPSFLVDPRKPSSAEWQKAGATGLAYGAGAAADLLMVKSTPEMIERIDAFLSNTVADVPQVEVEVTIIELTLSDDLSQGIQLALTRGDEDDPEGNLLTAASVELAQGLVSGAFGSFSAVQDESVINGLIELFQGTRYSNVLSSPKLAVLNGHRAVIDTGSKVPIFTPSFNASGITGIATTFKPTGVRVVATPFILSADTVQLDISVMVSNLSGFITAGIGSGAEIENPLIARRNAHTVVNVPSGKTVLIGGLVTTDEVETIDKVPVLGDIPLIGHLFKRTRSERRRDQVLFMVKPTIVRRGFRDGVLYDPALDDE